MRNPEAADRAAWIVLVAFCVTLVALLLAFVFLAATRTESLDARNKEDEVLRAEVERLKKENKQLALRILEWEDAAKYVL